MDIPLQLLALILQWIIASDPDRAAMAMLPMSEELVSELRELAQAIDDPELRAFAINELQ